MVTVSPSVAHLQALYQNSRTTDYKTAPNTFAVSAFVLANDLTAHNAYLRLARPGGSESRPSFLLESAIGGEKLDRYSFIGVNPRKTVLSGPGHGKEEDPLLDLEAELNRYRPDLDLTSMLPPLSGGAVGYVSYDCVRYFEPKTRTELKDVLKLPESALMFFDTIVAFDNVFQRIQIIHNVHVPDDLGLEAGLKHLAIEFELAEVVINEINTILTSEEAAYTVPQAPVKANDVYTSNIGQDGYEEHVRTLKKHILKGDIIQAVPSQRVQHKTDLHPFNVFRHLRTINPSPYLFYLDFIDFQVVGASPELLVKFDKGRIVTHPIAGTVKRGKTSEEDDRLSAELLASTKDRAEHVMLVDLARNDVNRVCDPTTTSVDRLLTVERFSHVMHLVSQVSGVLRPDKTRFDAFRSIFPAGTVSGAPKVRAMQLIGQLEGERRGVYAGAVGHWGYDPRAMNTCIALRTMVLKDGVAYLQAGGGIVHDSDPYDEYVETVNKMNANKACLEQAEKLWQSQS